ncbi:phosphodiester glycosidase family protein [Altererythrobacter sp. MF3-039]|uniref:phosphodiester glycosidase family protein n=1 Tax=Altererythrobacter sp. MF3-039 TaxID=3252901 RepID=UPI00390C45D8
MKKLIFLAPLAASLALAACDIQQGGEPVVRHDISGEQVTEVADGGTGEVGVAPAPAFASDCTPHFFEEVLFTDCVASPDTHRIDTALAPESGVPFGSLAAFSETVTGETIAFAVNAGIFDPDGLPIGYFVENRERLEELNRGEGDGNFFMAPNGVFYGTDGSWRIRTTQDFYSNVGDRPQFGTQSGPMLLIGGEMHPDFQDDGPSKAIRNGVGIDDDGKAHFVISEAPVSFGKLARFYRDELKVKNALYLDGNVSSLWDPAKNRLDTGKGVGPILVVKKRQDEAGQ